MFIFGLIFFPSFLVFYLSLFFHSRQWFDESLKSSERAVSSDRLKSSIYSNTNKKRWLGWPVILKPSFSLSLSVSFKTGKTLRQRGTKNGPSIYNGDNTYSRYRKTNRVVSYWFTRQLPTHIHIAIQPGKQPEWWWLVGGGWFGIVAFRTGWFVF